MWFLIGFLLVLGIETLFRIASKYEAQDKLRQSRTQVSFPWYAYVLGIMAVRRKRK